MPSRLPPPLRQLLAEAPVVLDGAWGTQLHALGLEPGTSADGWNLTHPEEVGRVARSYVLAGSRIILTNTFGASRIALGRYGLAGRAGEVNRAGARISCEAASGKAYVFASIGPSGELLAAGRVDAAQLREAFSEQAQALACEPIDGIVLETFSDPQEIEIALAAARATGLPVVACMVFDSGPARDRTMMGTTVEEAARLLSAGGADVVGMNCGRGIDGCASLCRRMRAATDRPLWFKPNAGLPALVDGRAQYGTSAESFAAGTAELVAAGARFVGGCCGTDPDFIRALAQRLAAGARQ